MDNRAGMVGINSGDGASAPVESANNTVALKDNANGKLLHSGPDSTVIHESIANAHRTREMWQQMAGSRVDVQIQPLSDWRTKMTPVRSVPWSTGVSAGSFSSHSSLTPTQNSPTSSLTRKAPVENVNGDGAISQQVQWRPRLGLSTQMERQIKEHRWKQVSELVPAKNTNQIQLIEKELSGYRKQIQSMEKESAGYRNPVDSSDNRWNSSGACNSSEIGMVRNSITNYALGKESLVNKNSNLGYTSAKELLANLNSSSTKQSSANQNSHPANSLRKESIGTGDRVRVLDEESLVSRNPVQKLESVALASKNQIHILDNAPLVTTQNRNLFHKLDIVPAAINENRNSIWKLDTEPLSTRNQNPPSERDGFGVVTERGGWRQQCASRQGHAGQGASPRPTNDETIEDPLEREKVLFINYVQSHPEVVRSLGITVPWEIIAKRPQAKLTVKLTVVENESEVVVKVSPTGDCRRNTSGGEELLRQWHSEAPSTLPRYSKQNKTMSKDDSTKQRRQSLGEPGDDSMCNTSPKRWNLAKWEPPPPPCNKGEIESEGEEKDSHFYRSAGESLIAKEIREYKAREEELRRSRSMFGLPTVQDLVNRKNEKEENDEIGNGQLKDAKSYGNLQVCTDTEPSAIESTCQSKHDVHQSGHPGMEGRPASAGPALQVLVSSPQSPCTPKSPGQRSLQIIGGGGHTVAVYPPDLKKSISRDDSLDAILTNMDEGDFMPVEARIEREVEDLRRREVELKRQREAMGIRYFPVGLAQFSLNPPITEYSYSMVDISTPANARRFSSLIDNVGDYENDQKENIRNMISNCINEHAATGRFYAQRRNTSPDTDDCGEVTNGHGGGQPNGADGGFLHTDDNLRHNGPKIRSMESLHIRNGPNLMVAGNLNSTSKRVHRVQSQKMGNGKKM